ncbi:MAG: peptide MFS transporter [Bacteroidetes Order II. Incertae sedis bacterium]|jgi:proton-dependent oligopeptide transporter, POT family|nr:peptide MFS transporter [Bacteroidetes Order II. bacterium]HAY35680.1 MFS transporter [Bacteroidota bacterium]MBT5249355.1 peptide MFS transporter [Bacteroidetes Order II. bacterium]MBT6200206.1 peptide MFS transporter [Bacteroidetes Order II. bacterium]MBT6425208.1 peptide MFS transporter [Bacteroidetes Order II. bacterium]
MSHTALAADKKFFGHPRGLATLFFTEMWERFSYYGMRALLILFMTAAVTGDNPGMGLSDGTSAAIYGLYTSLVYLLALPGGWVADQIWGQQKAVFVGGVIIAAGHFSMAIPMMETFFVGLILIVIGTGLLKPNVSTVVGELYPEGGAERDAGFSVYYMGINLGAFLGPLLCGYFGEGINWHYGFSLAGFGMVLGLVQYKMGTKYLGDAGALKSTDTDEEIARKTKKFYLISGVSAALLVVFGYLVSSGVLDFTLTDIAEGLGSSILIIVAVYFIYLIFFGGHTQLEKKRLGIIFWLFILAAIFWSGFEQAGSSLNLFADRMADRSFGDWEMPASWLQSVNSTFIIIFAPLFGSLWITLARIKKHPSFLVKFALGLLGLGAGFFVIAWGAANAEPGTVGITFLIVTYFLHTVGELCLSPVGMSSITKLAPEGRVGQMMGIWFVATALGNLIAGLVAGDIGALGFDGLFQQVAMISAGAGVVALLLAFPLRRFTGGVE